MPVSTDPASIVTGAGINPQNTVEDSSLTYPRRDTDSLRAHLLDPHDAHMAATIGIVDAGGFFSSTEVEGALQELGSVSAGITASRQNGVLTGCTYSAVGTVITLAAGSEVLIGTSVFDVSGQSVALPANGTNYVYVDSTGTLTFNAALPPLTANSVLLAAITTTAGAITGSRDGRFFVADLDRKLDYTVRSDGASQNREAEACFVTLDAALFWLQNYVTAGQESKSIIYIRGEHTLAGTITLPSGVGNVTFVGETGAILKTGGSLSPMFDVSGTRNITFKNLIFRCEHVGSKAIGTLSAAALTSGLRVEGCTSQTGAQAFDRFLDLNLGARHDRHVITGCSLEAAQAVRILNAGNCLVDDSTITGTSLAGSVGVELRGTTSATSTDGCLISFVRATLFDKHFFVEGWNQTITDCSCVGGRAVEARNVSSLLVHNGNFLLLTDTTAGIYLDTSQNANITDCYLSGGTFAGVDDPAGISGIGLSRTAITGCRFFGFLNAQIAPTYDLGAAIRSIGLNSRVVSCGILNCGVGIDDPGSALRVDSCEISQVQRGMLVRDPQITNTSISVDSTRGLCGVELINTGSNLYCQVDNCVITSGRAGGSYTASEYPSGIRTSTSGTLKVSNSKIQGFYNTLDQRGGGVLVGSLKQASLIGCVFIDNGITIDPLALTNVVDNVIVSGCSFVQTNSLINLPGIYLDAPTYALTDLTITDCQFTLTSLSARAIGLLFTSIDRVKVSGCTYVNASAGASTNSFLYVQGGTSVAGLSVSDNTLGIPAGTTSPAFQVNSLPGNIASSVTGVQFSGNQVKCAAPSAGLLAFRVAGEVSFLDNLVEGMSGIDLGVSSTDIFSTVSLHNNRFLGRGFPNAFRAVSTSVSIPNATTYYLKGLHGTGNFFSELDQVVEFNPAVVGTGACSLGSVTLTGNKIEDCRLGLQFVGNGGTSGVNISGNELSVRRWALQIGSALSSTNEVAVSGNSITVSSVGGASSDPVVKVVGTTGQRIQMSGNNLAQTGNQGGDLHVDFSDSLSNVDVSDNTVFYTIGASNGVSVYIHSSTPSGGCNTISANRNVITRSLGGDAFIHLDFGVMAPGSPFYGFQICDNQISDSSSAGGRGIQFSLQGAFGASLQSVQICRNSIRETSIGILAAVKVTNMDSVSVDDNMAVNPVQRGFSWSEFYTAGSKAHNVSVSRNKIYSNGEYTAFYFESNSLVSSLKIDENQITKNSALGALGPTMWVELGDPGIDDMGMNVSISRNLISPEDETATLQGTVALQVRAAGGVASNPNIRNVSIDENLIYRHAGAGIEFSPETTVAAGCSVSRNKIDTVGGSGIVVGGGSSSTSFQNLLVEGNQLRSVGGTGISFSPSPSTCSIDRASFSANLVNDTVARGIYLTPTTTADLTVSANNLTSIFSASSPTRYALEVYGSGLVDRLSLTGNVIRAFFDGGIQVYSGSDLSVVEVSSNEVDCASQDYSNLNIAGLSSVSNVSVESNNFRGNKNGVRVGAATSLEVINIVDNAIELNSAALAISEYGIQTSATSTAKSIHIADNIVRPRSSSDQIDRGIYFLSSGATENITVLGNNLEYCVIMANFNFNASSVNNFSFDDNTAIACGSGVRLECDSGASYYKFSVSRNTMQVSSITTGYGIDFYSAGGILASKNTNLQDLRIDNNKIENLYSNAGQSEAVINARFESVGSDWDNVSICGNEIRGGRSSIWFLVTRSSGDSDCSNVRVCDNNIYGWKNAYPGLLVHSSGDNTGTATDRVDAVNWEICGNNVRANDNDQMGISLKFADQSVNINFSNNRVFANSALTNFRPFSTTVTNSSAATALYNFVVMGNSLRNSDLAPTHTGPAFDGGTVMGNISTNGTVTLWSTWAGSAITSNLLPAVINTLNVET